MAYVHPMPVQPTDLTAFHTMVEAAITALPPPFDQAARNLVISVVDMPPPDLLDQLETADPMTLTGLYEGVPLPQKSVAHQAFGPDLIWLFRLPILAEWRDRGNVDLPDLVSHVLVHELAHHFGWSDDDIARIDRWWE